MKGFVSEIHINQTLKSIFNQFMGNRRFLYNHLLRILLKYQNKKGIKYFYDNGEKYSIHSKKGLQKITTYFNEKYDFLTLSHSQSNQSRSHDISKAWSNYCNPSLKNFGWPKFKRKKRDCNSFFIPNQNNIFLQEKKIIYIKPFDNFLKRKLENKNLLLSYNKITIKNKIPQELLEGKITGIRIKEEKEKYFISINYEEKKSILPLLDENKKHYLETLDDKKIIGIDLGLKTKLITSTGEKYDSIITSSSYKEKKLKKRNLQKQISSIIEKEKKKIIEKRIKSGYKKILKKEHKKIVKSRKKNKYRNKIEIDKLKFEILKTDYQFSKEEWKKIYQKHEIKKYKKEVFKCELKLKHIRENENHQISHKIVSENDAIFMENLTLKGMQKLWGNKIKHLRLNHFVRLIKYKTENQGKLFYQIDRFYPSTKTCSVCGNIQDMKLSDRVYHCKECNSIIDRDINRSINVKNRGKQDIIKFFSENNQNISIQENINSSLKNKNDTIFPNIVSKEIELIPSFETFGEQKS